MKTKIQILMMSIISMAAVTATTTAMSMTLDEVLSAIDGEYDSAEMQRVNFEISGSSSGLLKQVLSGIDGEYDHSGSDVRHNFSMSSDESDSLRDYVLSGVDGEYH